MLSKMICFICIFYISEALSVRVRVSGLAGEITSFETDERFPFNEIHHRSVEALQISPDLLSLSVGGKTINDYFETPQGIEILDVNAVVDRTKLDILEGLAALEGVNVHVKAHQPKAGILDSNRERNEIILNTILKSDEFGFSKGDYVLTFFMQRVAGKREHAILKIIQMFRGIMPEGSDHNGNVEDFSKALREWSGENGVNIVGNEANPKMVIDGFFIEVSFSQGFNPPYDNIAIFTIKKDDEQLLWITCPLIENVSELLDNIRGKVIDQLQDIYPRED